MSKMELRLAGSGGQGVILASVILAEAAVQSGKYTAQSQSYGPEARGGACKAETLISDDPIGFTKVQQPTFLMALTQKALDTYTRALPENCLVLVDEGLTVPENLNGHRVLRLPILRTAKETVGRAQTANVLAVGCINALLGITDMETLKKAASLHIPRGTEEINLKALAEGVKLASAVPGEGNAPAARSEKKKGAKQ
ncbi:MAG: 2-oxoacid:acceptor oxidoreductase family protein [Clostridia bacterium]|jgi:2-oxoglutarate ferredoxin oxidoreductase subunit gamma|nr:2-oxoacid:acceptor oxidoreductase family protein [Clostridia bacterium]MBR3740011.1 2-oxoacid:acceptor oxidoreductase family protein [Clostridia bacterium]MBR4361002.1 2-oxoacid:acceptor oxidoreductase family protein [Clostridia bacterium]